MLRLSAKHCRSLLIRGKLWDSPLAASAESAETSARHAVSVKKNLLQELRADRFADHYLKSVPCKLLSPRLSVAEWPRTARASASHVSQSPGFIKKQCDWTRIGRRFFSQWKSVSHFSVGSRLGACRSLESAQISRV